MRRGVAALLPLFLATCSSSSAPEEVRSALAHEENPPADGLAARVAANTDFAVSLYKNAAADETRNLVFSPHSVSTVFAMLYVGANGETAEQIANVFGFTPSVHADNNYLDMKLASREQQADAAGTPFALRTASSMWGQAGAPFTAPFLDTLAVNYDAGIHVVEFADFEGARQQINGWVNDNTASHIPELIPKGVLTDRTKLVLTNAIYMKAAWVVKFDADRTADQTFHVPSGDMPVAMMHGNPEARFVSTDSYSAVELPYDGVPVSMTIVMPNDLAGFEATLSRSALDEMSSAMGLRAVDLALPKFEFSQSLDLGAALPQLGVTDAFDSARVDLTGVDNDPSLFVQSALTKGFISVDEDGTTAAAATEVAAGDDAGGPEPATMTVDRPFLFFVRDMETHEILFIGRVVNPQVH
ncbi:MAG TPA: serpin family protein [Kofleriaceae bacterium]|jgi:serpin B